MKNFTFGLLILVFSFSASAGKTWYDKSHSIFLPRSSQNQIVEVQQLPVFWWNFIILQIPEQIDDAQWALLSQSCDELLRQAGDHVRKASCGMSLPHLKSFLKDWVSDYPLRHSIPTYAQFTEQMNQTLVKLTLPVGRDLISVLRTDPVGAIDEAQKLLKNSAQLPFATQHGFYFDPQTRRALVAVQFNFPPDETAKTQEFIQLLQTVWPKQTAPFLLGPHASTLENETRVKADLDIVSWSGTGLLTFFVLLAVFTQRLPLLYLLPPLGLAVGLSVLLTILVFGTIHGLTLSFGPGIVGLAMHYGLQASFSFGPDRRIWRANFFGVLTTLAILIIVMFSQLPLLQQIMFFSSVGLTLAFVFFYFLQKRWPKLFHVEPFHVPVFKSKVLTTVALILAVLAFAAPILIQPDFNIRQLNFESASTSQLGRWLYTTAEMRSPLISIHSSTHVLATAHEEAAWAQAHNLKIQNVAQFLPSLPVQNRNLESWRNKFCPSRELIFSPQLEHVFSPFFDSLKCGGLTSKSLVDFATAPSYLSDFHTGNRWVSLWMPTSEKQESEIHAHDPDATSLLGLVSAFPKTLSAELSWMLPLAFAVAFVLLIFYCRSFWVAVLALIPFLSGVGLFVVAVECIHWQVTLISLIGLIKVFGFSLDYGIFVTDLYANKDDQHARGVWTALSLNSYSTILGFLPLIFCKHPVLRQLGETLVAGAIGNYIGALWGISPFANFIERRSRPRLPNVKGEATF